MGLGRQQRRAVQERRRADRGGEGESRQDQSTRRAATAARSTSRWRSSRRPRASRSRTCRTRARRRRRSDVAGGQVPVAFQGLATVTCARARRQRLKLHRRDDTQTRLPQFPDVPTVSESGLAGIRVQLVVRDHGAGGNPEGDHRATQCRDRESARPIRKYAKKLCPAGADDRGTSAQELGVATREQSSGEVRAADSAKGSQHHAGLTDGSKTRRGSSLSDMKLLQRKSRMRYL